MSDTAPETVKDTAPQAQAPGRGASTNSRSLAGVRLLASLSPDALRALQERCIWRTFPPNDIIFDIDDDQTDVCFIVRGKLRILIFGRHGDQTQANPTDGPEDTSANSDEQVALAEMFSGDTFGELSAIDGRPRSARAIASDNCVIAMLPRSDFLDLLRSHPDMCIALLSRFAGMLRSMNLRVYSLATMTPAQRIYVELLRLAQPNPQGDGSWLIDTLPPHGDIADWAGAGRETVGTAIGQLAREGIVERRHRSLVIKDHARLRLLAHL